MQICYLDESGNHVRKGTTSHFVIVGLAIPADRWKAHDAEVAKVLHQHQLIGEVHTRHGWLDAIRNKSGSLTSATSVRLTAPPL